MRELPGSGFYQIGLLEGRTELVQDVDDKREGVGREQLLEQERVIPKPLNRGTQERSGVSSITWGGFRSCILTVKASRA